VKRFYTALSAKLRYLHVAIVAGHRWKAAPPLGPMLEDEMTGSPLQTRATIRIRISQISAVAILWMEDTPRLGWYLISARVFGTSRLGGIPPCTIPCLVHVFFPAKRLICLVSNQTKAPSQRSPFFSGSAVWYKIRLKWESRIFRHQIRRALHH
jgi:hypothetical protein